MSNCMLGNKIIEFYNIPDECLLHYALERFDEFNRFMYSLKNKQHAIGITLYYALEVQMYKMKMDNFAHLCIGKANYGNYLAKYNKDNPKTRKKRNKLITLLTEQLQAELSTLNKSSSQSQIVTTLIARDIWRMPLNVKQSLKIAHLLHANGEIQEFELGSLSPYLQSLKDVTKLHQTINLLNEGGKFCTYSQIYPQVKNFVIECERLKLPLVYNYSNLFIPITGLVDEKNEQEEEDYEDCDEYYC